MNQWRSFGVPCDSVKLFWHSSTQCHSHSGMGISLWDTLEVSHHVHIGVLLQYAQYRYLCTSVYYGTPRYTYHSHSGSCIWDTTHPASSASWLPCLLASEDYVQRRAFVSLLWDIHHIYISKISIMYVKIVKRPVYKKLKEAPKIARR